MFHLAWLCMGLLVASAADTTGPDSKEASDARTAYQARKAQAGRDAGSQVDLALWCEAHGLTVERTKHLALAALKDPNNAVARGLMGLVAARGQWENPDAAGARVHADLELNRKLAEYNRRRDELEARYPRETFARGQRASGDASGGIALGQRRSNGRKLAAAHAKLGLWCEQNGLPAEAAAHFTQAVVLDPYREATWKHLGYVKQDGRWMSRDRAEAVRKENDAQRQANTHWEPLLRKWRGWLGEKTRSAEAKAHLADVSDGRALPSVVKVFASGGEADQLYAIEILGRIDAPESTRYIAGFSVLSRFATVRGAATDLLRRREARDYAGDLVEGIRAAMKYQVQPVGGPGSPGALLVETPRCKALRTYDAPPAFSLSEQFFGYVGYDSNGLPVVARGREIERMSRESPLLRAADLLAIEARTMQMIAEANLKAADSQQRLICDVEAIEATNKQAAACNAQITHVLRSTVDAPAGLKDDDENGWHTWWYDKLGYRYESPPQQELAVNASPQYPPPRVYSCFAAGTPVRTLHGKKPIETLRVGDQVLGQDVGSGALGFHPVTVVHHNAPSETVLVQLDNGETLTASIYHRFWRAGRGWALARDLKSGDTLRTLGGVARVTSAPSGPVVPVFNLDVAQAHSFFVGENDALVHDNTLPDPHQKPFDLPSK
jgi:hypothetical protein